MIKEVFNAAGILAGIIASLAALGTGLIAVIGGVIASLFNGVTMLHTLLSVKVSAFLPVEHRLMRAFILLPYGRSAWWLAEYFNFD